MKKFLLVLIMLFTSNVIANLPDIVAVVNNIPITFYELKARRELIFVLNNIPNKNDLKVQKQVDQMALKTLIDEAILNKYYSEEFGSKISNEEINDFIKNIEERNNISKGGYAEFLKSKNIDFNSFRSQVNAELIKMHIASKLSKNVKVSSKEIDTVLLENNSKDAEISAKVFKSIDKSDKTLDKMHKLQKLIKGCTIIKPSLYNKFAKVTEIKEDLTSIDRDLQPIIKDLEIEKASNVFETKDGFNILVLCKREIKNLSSEENNYITNALINKKMSKNVLQFIDDLRKKSYIKIFI